MYEEVGPGNGRRIFGVTVVLVPLAHRTTTSVEDWNLRVVTPDELYRNGQFSRCGFDRVVAGLGIGTVISFRDSVDSPQEVWDCLSSSTP
jgi:hypothetical protein